MKKLSIWREEKDEYTEENLVHEGWYWFVPKEISNHNQPKFVYNFQDMIDDGWIKGSRMYHGKYVGPIQPPKLNS